MTNGHYGFKTLLQSGERGGGILAPLYLKMFRRAWRTKKRTIWIVYFRLKEKMNSAKAAGNSSMDFCLFLTQYATDDGRRQLCTVLALMNFPYSQLNHFFVKWMLHFENVKKLDILKVVANTSSIKKCKVQNHFKKSFLNGILPLFDPICDWQWPMPIVHSIGFDEFSILCFFFFVTSLWISCRNGMNITWW